MALLIIGTIFAVVILDSVAERRQRRVLEWERRREERRFHLQLLDELQRHD